MGIKFDDLCFYNYESVLYRKIKIKKIIVMKEEKTEEVNRGEEKRKE